MLPLITAHSGCEGTPDNSIASLQAAMQAGADCCEVDVRLNTRGELVLSHDAPTTQPVTLRQAFECILPSTIGINCDLKQYDALYPTLRLALRMGLPAERLVFSGSVDVALLRADEGIVVQSRIFLNSEELCVAMAPHLPRDRAAQANFLAGNATAVAQMLAELRCEALNAPHEYFTDGDIAALQAAGVRLSLWTANDRQTIARLLPMSLHNITTRQPTLALSMLAAGRR